MNFKLPVEAHLTEEVLLRFLDGELDKRATERAARHLDSCWTCRSKREHFRLAMDRFVHLEEALIDAAIASAPRTWTDLRPRLTCAEPPREKRKALLPQQFVRAIGMVGAAIAIAVWLMPGSSVSAMEILERSAASERPLLESRTNPLVLQRLRVESASRAASWSLWDAPQSRKFQQLWDIPSGNNLRGEMERLYSANGLDLKHPLSASNHAQWRRSLAQRRDSVREQGDLLAVITTNQDRVRAGDIAEAELWVRRSDWHPVRETFRVAQAGGAEEYRIIETAFHVENLDAVSARMFDSETPAADSVRSVPRPAVSIQADGGGRVSSTPAQADLAGAEVEALALLHEMDADRQDSAEVELTGNSVQVTAYTASQDRKLELESHLGAIPLVNATVHLLTDAQEMAAAKPVELGSSPSSEPPLFLKPLVQQTGSLEVANRIVSDEMDLLRRLCIELDAVKDLQKRFPVEMRESLMPRSVSTLDGLVLDHLDAARQVWLELERNGAPLLAALGSPVDESAGAGASCGDWYRLQAAPAAAAQRLEDLFARAFTALAGAPSDISEQSIVAELPGLRAKLTAQLAEGCLR